MSSVQLWSCLPGCWVLKLKNSVACLANAVLCDSVVSADEGLIAADIAES